MWGRSGSTRWGRFARYKEGRESGASAEDLIHLPGKPAGVWGIMDTGAS
jgi:hypothetical protein